MKCPVHGRTTGGMQNKWQYDIHTLQVVAHETPKRPVQWRGATCGMMELFLDWTFPWLNNSLTELFLDWTFDLFHEWTFSLVLKLHNSELYSELPFMIAMWLCTFQNHIKPLGKSKLTLASTLPWKAYFQRLALDDAHTQRTPNLLLAISFAVRVLTPLPLALVHSAGLSYVEQCWANLEQVVGATRIPLRQSSCHHVSQLKLVGVIHVWG